MRRSGRLAASAVTLSARPDEDRFTLLLERRQGRIGVGQRCGACGDRLGERCDTGAAEQRRLERGEVVQYGLRGRLLHLGVIDKCP